jgi:cytochrome P450
MKTTGAVIAFIHSMFLYPKTAQKVFEEIQNVTQGQRLLKIKDQQRLPFTEAVFKESIRRHPFAPLGY